VGDEQGATDHLESRKESGQFHSVFQAEDDLSRRRCGIASRGGKVNFPRKGEKKCGLSQRGHLEGGEAGGAFISTDGGGGGGELPQGNVKKKPAGRKAKMSHTPKEERGKTEINSFLGEKKGTANFSGKKMCEGGKIIRKKTVVLSNLDSRSFA